jgi:hypothetical protein
MQQRRAGLITEADMQMALTALFNIPNTNPTVGMAPDTASTLARARSTVRSVVPEFRGEQSDGITAGRWFEKFELESTEAGLPEAEWPQAAVGRFPTGCSARLWVSTVFDDVANAPLGVSGSVHPGERHTDGPVRL